jgi:hypothetical protein
LADRATPDPVIAEARKCWQKCDEASEAQRKRMVAAKKFRALDQWPDAIKIQREGGGSIAGQPPQPPRPCLVVDRLSQPCRQISNTIKNADFGFDVQPVGQGADVETAEIFQGYLRRVQNEARGESPVEWAADGAIEGGIGWFRLRSDYVHQTWDGVPEEAVFDQELRMERIANNLTVYCDPSAMRPTRSDAQFMLVTEDMDRDEFERKYPDADLRGLEEFSSTGDMDGWVSDSIIRIAEYWRITYTDRPFYWLKDGSIGEGRPPKGADVRMQRTMKVPTVKGYKINAVEVLEQWDWAGSRIPLIPVIGEELNVDGKPVLRGVIEMGMDAQRMVNYTYSGAIEIYALASKKAPMIPGAAVSNYKAIWDTRNIVNYSYLPYDPWDEQGRPLDKPTLDTTDAPIQASVALMQVSEEAIKASTSTGDASLGNTNPNERSGKALQALQVQSELANSNYPDNVRRAYIYAATLMLEIIPKITRPGQILHILGMDDEPKQVMVGKPFKPGQNGVPEPAPDDITAELAKVQGSLYKFYDLNNGTYHCTVTMGKATATRREEGAQALGNLLPHLPPEMQVKIIPDYIKQLSFPGAQAIAEKLEPPAPDQALPPQVQAQMQQLQQQNAELQKAVETDQVKAQATIEAAKVKAEADLRAAQMDADVRIRLAEMDHAAKIEVARITAAKEPMNIAAQAAEERLATGLEQAHDVGLTAMEQAHERDMAAQSHAQALEQGAAQAANAAESQATDQAHQAEMADKAAEQAEQQRGEE